MVWYGVVRYGTERYSVVWCGVVRYGALWYVEYSLVLSGLGWHGHGMIFLWFFMEYWCGIVYFVKYTLEMTANS